MTAQVLTRTVSYMIVQIKQIEHMFKRKIHLDLYEYEQRIEIRCYYPDTRGGAFILSIARWQLCNSQPYLLHPSKLLKVKRRI